jgi:CubicO group peptidase (beta-lactamase class C family)
VDGVQGTSGFNRQGLAQIGPALQAIVDQGHLSGAVALVWHRGQVVQVDAVGKRDIAGDLPMRRDTLFRIASMTKPVTSAAIMMLVEEGKLKLEDPVSRWIPELGGMQVLKDPTGPLDAVEPALREITIEDLLTHRSGLGYAFSSQGPIAYAHEEALGSPLQSPLTPDDWLARLGELPLNYQPGERHHYSHATDVLGFVLSRIDGLSLGEALQRRIFGPLGMRDTSFWLPAETRGRLARLYEIPRDGGPLEDVSFVEADRPPAYQSGGGGLISSADDYLTFARMLLGRGEVDGVRLLKPETVDVMVQNRLTEVQRGQGFLGMPLWLTQGFGLGLSMILDPQKHRDVGFGAGGAGAFGWPGAFGTWWQADPANETILIYLIQDSMPLGPAAVTTMLDRRLTGRVGGPLFQKLVYDALE